MGVVLTTPFVGLLEQWLGVHPAALYLVVVLLTGGLYGVGPSLLAVVLAGLIYDYIFVRPYWSLSPPDDPQTLIELLVILLTALIAGQLAAALRRHAEQRLRRSEERFRAL